MDMEKQAEIYKQTMRRSAQFLQRQIEITKGKIISKEKTLEKEKEELLKTREVLHQLEMELNFVKGLFAPGIIDISLSKN